jgi:hypothetical protein
MAPLITLYILAACVAVAAGLFVVMLVLTAVRPPRLPDVVPLTPEPPLQRVIRALTPAPIAMARSTPVPLTMMAATPAPAPIAREVVVRTMAPTVVERPIPPIVAPPIVPKPAVVAKPVVEKPAAKPVARPAKPAVTLPAHLDSPRRFIPLSSEKPAPGTVHPRIYPIKRTRVWPRVMLGVVVMMVATAGVVVAYPHVLDPLCDDYAWFGEDAAAIVREQAYLARETIAGWLAQI